MCWTWMSYFKLGSWMHKDEGHFFCLKKKEKEKEKGLTFYNVVQVKHTGKESLQWGRFSYCL